LDLKQADSVAATEELLRFAEESGIDTGLELMGIECDVASEESVMIAFEQIRSKFGRVDAVVASAGMPNAYPYWPHEFTLQRYRGELLCP
jgi:NAD(P)-dependent dehydrogenase (short-subunit alcohol dehydrogenase family)